MPFVGVTLSHAKRVYDREKPQENQMQTLSLEIDDNDDYDYENNYPEELVVSSEEEVRARVYEAEKRIENGEFHTEDEYNRLMDKFFEEELGIQR